MAFSNMLEYGEYFKLYLMDDDVSRPYSLAVLLIHPLRVKTPTDLAANEFIRDGIEFSASGKVAAYWVKKSAPNKLYLGDSSSNFERIPAKTGHRWNIVHSFVQTDPEAVRGIPIIAPAMKLFRDLSDYLDAELVSNIVTAAFALFIETTQGMNPLYPAQNLSSERVAGYDRDGRSIEERYQEVTPGLIMYGANGQKPHPIAAARPGTTFAPFTTVIKKAAAMSVNIPYPVAFNDVEGTNFAGFRSAMLSAWRVFMARRTWMGRDLGKEWALLQEEAYLRGDLPGVKNFYSKYFQYTRCEWRGSPKGDIEPVKAAQANALKVAQRVMTRSQWIIEDGGDPESVFSAVDEELAMMIDKGIMPESEIVTITPETARENEEE
jgi:lambda family phage portal protein